MNPLARALALAVTAYTIQLAALLLDALLPYTPPPRAVLVSAPCGFCGTADDDRAWCCDDAMDADRAAWIEDHA